MKTWMIIFGIAALTSVGVVVANQESSINPRVISQRDGTTAADQSNRPMDIAVTRQIRAELMKDDGLSTTAKNIKIIVFNNGVTLKGDVKSDDERAKILKHAYVTAPKHRIYNQIVVK